MRLTQRQLEGLLNNTHLDHKKENLIADCPSCGQHEFGIAIYKDHHPFNCYRKSKCGFIGNIYNLLTFLGRSKEFIKDQSVNSEEPLKKIGQVVNEIVIQELPEVAPPVLWKRVYEDQYLRSRGFVDYQFEKFEVGRSSLNKDYITFLVRQNNKITGYIGRSEKSKQWIDRYNEAAKRTGSRKYLRYRNSTSDFGKMLFGLDEIVKGKTTDIILVEGIFSKTKTDVNLQLDEQDEMKCCATFGAKLSEYQIALLKDKGIKTLWLWFESDVINKVKKIASEAALHFNVRACYLNGKDPNDIEANEALTLLDSSFDWLEFNINFVNSIQK